MNLSRHYLRCSTLILIFVFFHSPGNTVSWEDELTLEDQGKSIENIIEIHISRVEYQNVKIIDGTKISLKKPLVIINGDSISSKDIHTRGKSTLNFRRKSFSFSLEKKAKFLNRDQTMSMKKFYAISLSMDKSYIRNRLAFEMMEEIQLFELFYSYCELRINDHSEGIYLIVERPQDWAMKKKNSPFVIRRGFNHKIDKIKTSEKIDKSETKNYKNYYSRIYKSLKKYEGRELYEVLSQWLDVEVYMKWLAFNFFVRNGDYTDEVYFCINPAIDKFMIIPWDYDDIFAAVPHEGMHGKKKAIGDKFIFSSEDLLDKKIVNDPYLYKEYLIQLKKVLSQLSSAALKNVFQNTYADLFPYYSKEDIIDMSQYDQHKNVNFETLEMDMNTLYNQLIISRISFLSNLKETTSDE